MGELHRRTDSHFLEYPRAMHLDRAHRYRQFVGNHLVEFAGEDLIHHLAFAGGELGKLLQHVFTGCLDKLATCVRFEGVHDDIDQIVQAAMARAAEAPAAAPAAAVAPATTTPAIPTSASVANQATTPNAIDLREINLLGISGPSNARRALVRMENGRYVTVKVGDRLDGGRVTSITSDGLTYQKGARNYTLQLLPLG